jgi:hypothetical protein
MQEQTTAPVPGSWEHVAMAGSPQPPLFTVQASVQLPAPQASPVSQTLPQDPQLFESFCSSTQALPHDVKPELQAEPHALPEQVGVAFGSDVVQTLPQAPQLFTSVVVSVHTPPQNPRPPLHAEPHSPAEQ